MAASVRRASMFRCTSTLCLSMARIQTSKSSTLAARATVAAVAARARAATAASVARARGVGIEALGGVVDAAHQLAVDVDAPAQGSACENERGEGDGKALVGQVHVVTGPRVRRTRVRRFRSRVLRPRSP